MGDKYHHCNYCHYYGDCSIDKHNEPICKKCVWKDILLDAARKRPASEKPEETVLVKRANSSELFLGEYNKTTRHWYDEEGWHYEDSDVDGWFPIRHLIEGN